MPRPLRAWQMLNLLHRRVNRYATDAAAALAFGVSRGHLSHVLSGHKPISDGLAHALGYERQDCFIPYEYRK